MLKASRAERGASTTPEPPGITGPGPPVTEDASGGPHPDRKQGGTVEYIFRIPPLILHQGWDFLPPPRNTRRNYHERRKQSVYL